MIRFLRKIWCSSEFDAENVTRFAQPVMREEARAGIFALGLLTLLLMAGLATLYSVLGLGTMYLYTFVLLGLLGLHVAVSAKMLAKASELKVIYLIAIVLLAVCALAFSLLAHRYGVFSALLFSTVVLLLMVVPLVPWGMREALLAVGIVYVILTGSSLSVAKRFSEQTLLTLQFLMVSAAAISLALVWRATLVRKGHLEARYKLMQMNERLSLTSLQDSLTGAWNRRFLEERYDQIVAGYAASTQGYCLCLVDIDKFKQLNDTYGHIQGDHVLQRLVSVLEQALGPEEYVVRLGGDEFLLLLQGDHARQRLEHARAMLNRRKEARPGVPDMPSISIGVARVAQGTQVPLADLYKQADQALYAAKDGGRNAVVEKPFAQEQ